MTSLITRLLAVLSCGLVVNKPLSAQTVGGAPYVNSWLGNTYGLPADHIPHTIDNIYVTPSGNVATITEWEEGGANAALYNTRGGKVGIPQGSGTGGWGRMSGKAVFTDGKYLYQSITQNGGYDADGVRYPVNPDTTWSCVRRYNLDGTGAPFSGGNGYDGSFLMVHSLTSVTADIFAPKGIVVYNRELYVSDANTRQIKVYNASTMSKTPVRTFTRSNPGLMDVDRLGFIWMLDTVQKKLIRFSTTGALQSQSITFPSSIIPTSFCVDKVNDRILVTNNGNAQNVLIYTRILSTPSQTGTFGKTGGINSGTAGAIAPLKFSEPKGVGIDSAGNIFVGNNGVSQGGGRLEKYNSSGALQWRLNGLVFTANGDINASNEREFYTFDFKYNLNLGNTTPGSEWSPAAMTINKVKYPGDSRIPTVDNSFWTTALVRNISGRKLLYTSDMYSGSLGIYRFNAATDGETAIPSAFFEGGNVSPAVPDSFWRDANGNGARDNGETESYSPSEAPYGTHYFPDSRGGVWKSNRDADNNRIRYFPMQGFDGNGNPRYTYASSIGYTPIEIADVKRLEYDATNDVLYAIGRSNDLIIDHWWAAGNRLTRYNHFTARRTTAWSVALPYGTNTDLNVKAFCEAGAYLFLIAAKEGRIYVHNKSDGAKVGEILPTSATGNVSGWADINGAVRAYQRSNGEYLVFAEENGYGKINMYRWNPGGPAPTPAGSSIRVTSASTATRINLTSLGTSDWTKWGVTTNVASVVRKSAGGTKISNYTKAGTGTIQRYTDSLIGYTWIGGTPTSSARDQITGIRTSSTGTGFTFSVPADTTTRTLKVYAGGWNSTGELRASMSDGSVADYVATRVHGAARDVNTVYTVTYNAKTAGRKLNITWKMTGGEGECTLQAVTLQ